jgi:hypothetical protein
MVSFFLVYRRRNIFCWWPLFLSFLGDKGDFCWGGFHSKASQVRAIYSTDCTSI